MSVPRQCEQRMRYDFRTLAATVERAERRLDGLNVAWRSETQRVLDTLGLPRWLELPPLVFDVLARIEPTGDGHWLWLGTRNNRGTPTVRLNHAVDGRRTYNEGSAARFIHKALRGDPDRGAMHPLCEHNDCVLPQHRCRSCRAGVHTLVDCDRVPTFEVRPENWKAS